MCCTGSNVWEGRSHSGTHSRNRRGSRHHEYPPIKTCVVVKGRRTWEKGTYCFDVNLGTYDLPGAIGWAHPSCDWWSSLYFFAPCPTLHWSFVFRGNEINNIWHCLKHRSTRSLSWWTWSRQHIGNECRGRGCRRYLLWGLAIRLSDR